MSGIREHYSCLFFEEMSQEMILGVMKKLSLLNPSSRVEQPSAVRNEAGDRVLKLYFVQFLL